MPYPIHLALAVLALSGCIGTAGSAARPPMAGADALPVGASVTVLDRDELAREHGSLLSAMARHIPGLRTGFDGRCPALALRGPNPLPGVTDPAVYVDGAHAQDTCVLATLSTEDVERVEVYPMGFTTRPGYRGNAHGLILVFLRAGN